MIKRLSSDQFKFMSAGQLKAMYPFDFDEDEEGPPTEMNIETFWDSKLMGSRAGFEPPEDLDLRGDDKTLYDSISSEGVRTPVQLVSTDLGSILYHGHHRVAAAHDIDPSMMVPTEVVSLADEGWETHEVKRKEHNQREFLRRREEES